jgi:SAM-dependent methyltransferase
MIPERLVPETSTWETFEIEHQERYKFFAAGCKNLRVLDVACGVGYGSQLLALHGATSVTGVDISLDAIECARTRFTHPNVQFIEMDVGSLATLNREFDAVLSFETIEYLIAPESLIREVRDVLTPGGLFVCSTPNRDYEHRLSVANPYHLCEWNDEEFHAAFSRYFEIDGQFHQSPSPAYLRHLEMLSVIESIQKKLRLSVAFRLEAALRRTLGKQDLNGYGLAESL